MWVGSVLCGSTEQRWTTCLKPSQYGIWSSHPKTDEGCRLGISTHSAVITPPGAMAMARAITFSSSRTLRLPIGAFVITSKSKRNSSVMPATYTRPSSEKGTPCGFNDTIYTATATTDSTPLAAPVKLAPTAGYLAPISDASPPDGTNARRLQLALRFRF
jgi:hypothetical protein